MCCHLNLTANLHTPNEMVLSLIIIYFIFRAGCPIKIVHNTICFKHHTKILHQHLLTAVMNDVYVNNQPWTDAVLGVPEVYSRNN